MMETGINRIPGFLRTGSKVIAASLSIGAISTSLSAQQDFGITAGIWHIADAGLDSGGDWSAAGYRLKGILEWDMKNRDSLGLSFGTEYQDHSFDTSFEPWDSVKQFDFSLTWNKSLNDKWSLLAIPSVGFSMEDGADSSDAMRYGTIFSLNQFVSPELQWGFGFGYFGGLEDSTGFPLLFIRWQIDEQWYVGNPFTPGPVGPAGLEVGYRISQNWTLAGGSAYRSERFKLKNSGPYADGYGETEGAVLFLRSTYNTGSGQLHFLVGVLAAGELLIDDINGNTLMRTDFDPAPLAAITWQGQF